MNRNITEKTWRGMRVNARLWTSLTAGLVATLLVCGPAARANQSMEWPTDECESEYSLTLIGNGCFTLSPEPDDPEHPKYHKGQCVVVGFEPDENYIFKYWTCNPPSHIASYSTEQITAVFITSTTTLEAVTHYFSPEWALRVSHSCDYYLDGSISLPEGAYVSPSGCAWCVPISMADIGKDYTITAHPNNGCYTRWIGPGLSYEYIYADQIKLRSLGDCPWVWVDFPALPQPDYSSVLSMSTDPSDSADIWMSRGQTSGRGTFAPSQSMAVSPYGWGTFSGTIEPKDGQYVSYITYSGSGGSGYLPIDLLYYNINTQNNLVVWQDYQINALNYTVKICPAVKLNIEVEGHGVVRSGTLPNVFKHDWSALPYAWGNPGDPNYLGNPVDLIAEPSAGWQLDHWEVMGANGQYYIWYDQSPTITQYLNWHTWPAGSVNVPYGKTTHSVKAVFVQECYDMGPID